MKKKIIITAILAFVVAVPVFAASMVNDDQNDWFNQMLGRHQQMIQQNVDNGTITADEGAQLNDHFRQDAPIMRKIMDKNGMGYGMMGRGPGMMMGGRNGGQGPCSYYNNTETNK
ncbi:hypothetical protein SDC9_13795 [bioreactor metagenome]|uniref:DUF2680 domain-containing protein n=1 Tax=bioreactor metagenome TaxID=1076179 RepID=A0A644TP72_9ZZZZ|nr:hypothetical protein [Negativicutes bacterium]